MGGASGAFESRAGAFQLELESALDMPLHSSPRQEDHCKFKSWLIPLKNKTKAGVDLRVLDQFGLKNTKKPPTKGVGRMYLG